MNQLPRNVDVVLVGAGAVGAATAYELSRRGASVLVLDEGEREATGCSYANAGLLSPSHVESLATPGNVLDGLRFMFSPQSPFHLYPDPRLLPWFARFARAATPGNAQRMTHLLQRLARRGRDLHEEYAVELPTGLRASGSLDVFLTAEGLARKGLDPALVLDDTATHGVEPALGPVAGSVHHAGDAMIDSREFARALLSGAVAHGAEVRCGVKVSRVLSRGHEVTGVETDAGVISAGHVVLASGLGSVALAGSVGLRLPLRGARGYVLDLEVSRGAPRTPVTLKEHRVVVTPYADRLRLSGTLELGNDAAPMHERRVDAIRRAAAAAFPDLRIERTRETWCGLRPTPPDGVPVLGESRLRPRLVLATGHGMWGIVLAPVTAEMIATEVVEATPLLMDPALGPDRFTNGSHRAPAIQRAGTKERSHG